RVRSNPGMATTGRGEPVFMALRLVIQSPVRYHTLRRELPNLPLSRRCRMSNFATTTRREFVLRGVAAASAATFVPAHVLGRAGSPAPSKRITLGGIGFGPRCAYDLQAMLQHDDVQCLAVCDVQASRRQAGKKLVDGHYKTKDCKVYRDFRDLL